MIKCMECMEQDWFLKMLPIDAGRIRPVKNDSVNDCIGIFNKCMHK